MGLNSNVATKAIPSNFITCGLNLPQTLSGSFLERTSQDELVLNRTVYFLTIFLVICSACRTANAFITRLPEQASGFSEKEAKDLDAFVAKEGWGGGDFEADSDEQEDLDGDDSAGYSGKGRAMEAQRGEGGDEEEDRHEGVERGGDEEDEEEEEEEENDGVRIRRVKAPETVTKRAHAAVQRQRRAAGAGGAAKPTRNHQKKKEKGKMLYKHRDF